MIQMILLLTNNLLAEGIAVLSMMVVLGLLLMGLMEMLVLMVCGGT